MISLTGRLPSGSSFSQSQNLRDSEKKNPVDLSPKTGNCNRLVFFSCPIINFIMKLILDNSKHKNLMEAWCQHVLDDMKQIVYDSLLASRRSRVLVIKKDSLKSSHDDVWKNSHQSINFRMFRNSAWPSCLTSMPYQSNDITERILIKISVMTNPVLFPSSNFKLRICVFQWHAS